MPLLIANSEAGLKYARQQGYKTQYATVIANGTDTEAFRPQPSAGAKFRRHIGVESDTTLIGLVGRLDPMKGHETFLRAAASLVRELPHSRFLCVGDGPADYKRRLKQLVDELAIAEHVIWAGNRADMPAVYSALNVFVSSSYGEGFSNAISEAMACGLPCVVTDVGDSAAIVGDLGRLVTPRDPGALAAAIGNLLAMGETAEGAKLRTAVRRRIEDRFSVEALVARTTFVLHDFSKSPATLPANP